MKDESYWKLAIILLKKEWLSLNKFAFILFVIISIFLNSNSGNFKNIINLNVILTFTPSRSCILNLEHPPSNIIFNHPIHAKGWKLPPLSQSYKLIYMGFHTDNKQAFESIANVHKIQINAEPPPGQLSLFNHTSKYLRGDEKGMVCLYTLCRYLGKESLCLSCMNK